jgi:hypothetical protein|tara:strand:+ start:558 stop:746 length:189 start_codon:yes stop_codon:yes gene_type:complete
MTSKQMMAEQVKKRMEYMLKGGLKSSDLPSPISSNRWVAEQVKKRMESRKNWIKNKKENEDE